MKYLINDQNEYVGIDYLGDQPNSVDTPPKPLLDHEKAVWLGDHWDYVRNEIPDVDHVEDIKIDTKMVDIFGEVQYRMALGGGPRDIPKEDKISILIPCYGKATTIEYSLQSCLEQTMKPYQVVVLLMDESSKALKKKLEAMDPKRVVCVNSEQMNVCKARAKLVELCETEYFIFLDGDDELEKNYIEVVYKEDASIVFTQKTFSDIGVIKPCRGSGLLFPACVAGNNMTFLQCKTVWNELGGLDEDLCHGGEDTDYIIRLFCLDWRVHYTSDTQYLYNRWANGLSIKDEFETDYFKMIKKELPTIRRALDAVMSVSDWCYDFFNNDSNFKDIETCREQFYIAKMGHDFADRVWFGQIRDLIYKSRYKDCDHVWNEEDYIGECPEAFKHTCFDAIIFEPIGIETESVTMCIRKDIVLEGTFREQMTYLFTNYCVFAEFDSFIPPKRYIGGKTVNNSVSIALNYDCNRLCEYCNQAVGHIHGNPHPHFDDEEIYDRFDKMLTKMEEVFEGHLIPQVLGGEPTIWSEWLIKKIWKRLEKYPIFFLYSNHDIKDSLWEKNSKITWYDHVCDWHEAVIDPKPGHHYEVVVTHKEIPYLRHFFELNWNTQIHMDEYVGNEEEFKLTQEDRQYLANLEDEFPYIDQRAVMHNDMYIRGTEEEKDEYHEKCRLTVNLYQASCVYMLFWACCGIDIPGSTLETFDGSPVPKEYCKNCNMYNRGVQLRDR